MRRVMFVAAAVAAMTLTVTGFGIGSAPAPTVDPDEIEIDTTTTVTVSGEGCTFSVPNSEGSETQAVIGGFVEVEIVPPSGPPPIATASGPAELDGTWSFDIPVTPDELGLHDVNATCTEANGVVDEPQQVNGFNYPVATLNVVDAEAQPATAERAEPTFTG